MTAIRPATALDAGRLAEMRFEFRSSVDPPIESREAFVARCAAWMERELSRGGWHAWVAEKDGAVVGQIWLHVIEKVPNPVGERYRHAYISNLYVVPSARGGIGRRLLEAALAFCEAEHADRVVLWPTPASRTLYERYGFTPQGDVMERRCP